MALLRGGTIIYGTGTVQSILYVGGEINTGTAATSNTTTGALQVAGGVGIGGSLFVGGTVTATNFYGNVYATNTGTIQVGMATTAGYALNFNTATVVTTAVNIYGGIAGQIPYQSAAGITSFVSTGTTGQFLVSNGSGTPTWTSTSSLQIGFANTSGYATTSSYANTATTVVISTASNNATYYITFVSTSSGQLGVVSDAGAKLTYNPGTSILTIASTVTSTSTTTGALIVTGGVGVGGNIYAGNIYSNGQLVATGSAVFSGGNVSNIVYITTATGTTSTNSGALQVVGGVGIGGGVYVGGTVTATSIADVFKAS